MMIEDNFIMPSINVMDIDPDVGNMPLVTECVEDANVNTVMSNSFGFGGTNATLIMQKYN